jgi:hypothetical protein
LIEKYPVNIRHPLLFAAVLTSMTVLAGAAQCAEPDRGKEPLPVQKVSPEDYQSFVRNWDEKAHPFLLAAIQTPAQWDAVMAPAGVMGKHPPFMPADSQFAKHQLLIAARVMPAPDSGLGKCFTVRSATLNGDELTLEYQFKTPPRTASFTVTNYLGVWVPKRPAKKIVFVENGKVIGTLNLAGGQWSVPKLKVERAKP